MLVRLSIFVMTACVLNAAAYGELISFQHNSGLVTKRYAIPGQMQLIPFRMRSPATLVGLLAEHRSPIQLTGRELYVDAVPREA
jgi:hypothetical protein